MSKNQGKIIQIMGVVVDVEFDDDALPEIYEALTVKRGKTTITLEVAQHLDQQTVRAISLQSTDGLRRGQEVVATGAPISVPVGEATQGRMFNVVGEPIDPAGKSVAEINAAAEQWVNETRARLVAAERARRGAA